MIAPFFISKKFYEQESAFFFTAMEKKQNEEIDFNFAEKYGLLGNTSFCIQLFSTEINLGENGNLCYREICQNCMLYNINQVLTGCGFDLCHCSKKEFLLAKANNKNEAIE